jgi:hypothetical protein
LIEYHCSVRVMLNLVFEQSVTGHCSRGDRKFQYKRCFIAGSTWDAYGGLREAPSA